MCNETDSQLVNEPRRQLGSKKHGHFDPSFFFTNKADKGSLVATDGADRGQVSNVPVKFVVLMVWVCTTQIARSDPPWPLERWFADATWLIMPEMKECPGT